MKNKRFKCELQLTEKELHMYQMNKNSGKNVFDSKMKEIHYREKGIYYTALGTHQVEKDEIIDSRLAGVGDSLDKVEDNAENTGVIRNQIEIGVNSQEIKAVYTIEYSKKRFTL